MQTEVVSPSRVDTNRGSDGGGGGSAPARADLKASLENVGFADEGGTQFAVLFEVANTGPTASKGVSAHVTVQGANALIDATVRPPGEAARQCDLDTSAGTANCTVGEIAVDGVISVVVTIPTADPSVRVDVTATSDTEDPTPGNYSAHYP